MKKLLLILLILMVPNLVAASIPDGLNAACQVYLEMEEGASPMEDTLNNVDYTCTNCPEFQVDGVIGYAMNYTAANSDKMQSEVNNVFDRGGGDYTACFWIMKHDTSDNIYPWAQWSNTAYYGLQINDNGRPTAWVAYTSSGSRILIYGVNGDVNDVGWHFYCQARSGNNGLAWMDGAAYSDTVVEAGAPSISEDINCFGSDCTSFFNAAIDEFSYFDKALNITEVQYLYNSGSPGSDQQYPFGPADTTGPTFVFDYQQPEDIDTTQTFGKLINISYNITDISGVNTSSVKLFYKTNSSTHSEFYYVNGTAFTDFQSSDVSIVRNGDNFVSTLSDNHIYPATYNFDDEGMEDTAHNSVTINNPTEAVKVEFLNVSNTTQYNILEIMASNQTSASKSIQFIYCNDTYGSGNILLNDNCDTFADFNGDTYNHTHSSNSKHIIIPFAIVDGNIGSVKVTSKSYFIARSTGNPGYNIWYIANKSRPTTSATTGNTGSSWTPQTYTVDSHLHQFHEYEIFYYYQYACDNLSNCNTSDVRNDTINLTKLPPTSPKVIVPESKNYTSPINITYTESFSPNGFDIAYYNISLLNTTEGYLKTIKSNNSINLNYTWVTTGEADGNYIIKVEACDNQTRCSYGLSELFSLNNTPPTKWQYTYSNIVNGTNINLSNGETAFRFAFYSWNETNLLTKVYLNGTEQCSLVLANYTYSNCNITNLTAINGTYYATINNTYNESKYWFTLTSTVGKPSGEKLDYYMAIALICIALISFLVILSYRIETKQLDQFFFNIPMLKYFILVLTGWFLLGVFDVVVGIVETENIHRLTGATNAIYQGAMYTLWVGSAIWFIVFLYLLFMHFQSWFSK